MEYPNEIPLHKGLVDALKSGFNKELGKAIEDITEGEFSKRSEYLKNKVGVLTNRTEEDIKPASMFKRFKRALNPKDSDTPSIEVYDYVCLALLGKGISECALLYGNTVVVRNIYHSRYSKQKRNRPAKKETQSDQKITQPIKSADDWRRFFDLLLHKEPGINYTQLIKLLTIAGYKKIPVKGDHIVYSYPGTNRSIIIEHFKKDAPVTHLLLGKVRNHFILNKISEKLINEIRKEL